MTNNELKTTALLLSLFALPLFSRPQAPLLSDVNASALLEKSLAATNLRTPGARPFHFSSTIKYKSNGPGLTGRYEIFFSPPDRYRINLTIGKMSEIQVASGDKIFISRLPQKFSAEAWRIAEFMWSPGVGLQTPSKLMVGATTSYPDIKIADNCEQESDVLRVRRACFDSSRAMTSFSIQDQKNSRLAEDAVSLSDFHSLGDRRYPGRLIKKSTWDTIDATVESSDDKSPFDESTFTPPANSLARDWCVAPQVISNAPAPHRVVDYAVFVYYVLVGTDGRAKKLTFVNDPVQFALPQHQQALENRPYAVLACSGKPIEYEMVIITNSF